MMDEPSSGQRLYRAAADLTEPIGRLNYYVRALVGLGYATFEAEALEEAHAWFQSALAKSWQLGLIPQLLDAVAGLALVRARSGALDEATEWLRIVVSHPACRAATKAEVARLMVRLRGKEVSYIDAQPAHPQPETALASLVATLLDAQA